MTHWLTARRKEEFRLVVLALAIAVAQIVFATLCARGDTWRGRYLSLWTWDGGWYANIVDTGYHTTETLSPEANASNVAFFPAYPVLTRSVAKITGWSTPIALLLTSEMAAFVFWWFLLRQMRVWKIGSTAAAGVIMLTFCHPAAFYLVVTYADSLFMASMMGLLFWGSRMGTSVWLTVAAAVAGFVCSASRAVGAPLAAVPVVWAWNDLWPALKARLAITTLFLRLWRYSFVSLATAFGTISFFIYCAARFGHWDVYMRSRAAGWQVFKTDYLAMFSPRHFDISMPGYQGGFISPVQVSHLYVALLVISVFLLPIMDYSIGRLRKTPGFSRRVPFYLAAFLLLFFSASGSGVTSGQYLGFLRYGFYSHVPLLLAIVQARHDYIGDRTPSLGWQLVIFLACALGLALQAHFCYLFSHEVMVS